MLAALAAAIALLAGVLLWHPWRHPGTPPQSAPPPSSSVSPDTGRCANSDVPLHELEPHSPAEPRLALPQPPGWTFTTRLNSEVIRGSLINTALRANGFAPNAVVTLENLTGTAANPEQALALERDGIVDSIGPVATETPGTLCGYPALTVTYRMQGRPVTAVAVAGADAHQRIWAATVSMQTTEPDNPDYVAAKTAILDGFRFTLAATGR
ncbi:LpqN/LpqT family lipoprotein [Mycolicibacillus parakoreensis]|uniref:LpqN/LpqT family lipoprotein n=1 Tax=Mycolicibacillus parakoreensis TaxID=1069221 RepID=A0ABY3U473_9MYCO|nr:LpqN/LpqT family lipoprotein [Mycolicibacillus parakoreensis]